MYGIKVLLATSAICSAILALMLIWSEDQVTCGITTCKLMETMFLIVSLGLTREVCNIKIEK